MAKLCSYLFFSPDSYTYSTKYMSIFHQNVDKQKRCKNRCKQNRNVHENRQKNWPEAMPKSMRHIIPNTLAVLNFIKPSKFTYLAIFDERAVFLDGLKSLIDMFYLCKSGFRLCLYKFYWKGHLRNILFEILYDAIYNKFVNIYNMKVLWVFDR